MLAPDPLRTELSPVIQDQVDSMEYSPRPHQIPIEESRRLKREGKDEEAERGGDDPVEGEPVGRVSEFRIPGPDVPVPIRLYVPAGDGPFPAIVWFHGGGFVRGGLDGADVLARYLSNRLDATVVTVDYRLAPEHEFPAALLDCYAATAWIAANPRVGRVDPDRIAVGGTSAGGNLTAATALLARDRGGPALVHQLAGVPMLDAACDTDSHAENAEGYGLTAAGCRYYWDAYLGSDVNHANAYGCPLRARDLSGLPSTTLFTAGFDPLRDEGIAYAERLDEAGVPLDHLHFPGMPHHLSKFLGQDIDEAVRAWDDIVAEVRPALQG